jgi:hypothetical protein
MEIRIPGTCRSRTGSSVTCKVTYSRAIVSLAIRPIPPNRMRQVFSASIADLKDGLHVADPR